MVNGMSAVVSFETSEAEQRFLKWVEKGNLKADSLGAGSLGLTASITKLSNREYLFLWSHFFMVNMAWLLRLGLWFSLKKVRKSVKVRRVRKLDLVDLVISRGLKSE
jgi:hypothetical protein